MEDVIVGLLFVYFFVIRPLLKQARKAAQSGEGEAPTKAPGRRKQGSLGEFLAKAQKKLREVAEQVEAETRERAEPAGTAPGTSWQDLFAGPAPGPVPDPWEMEPGFAEEESEPAPEPRVAPPPVTPVTPVTPVAPVAPAAPVRRPLSTRLDLRQAVIWSEILGPPVSLRDGG